MRTLTADQNASFSSELLTIAVLVDLTLTDGTIIKLTDHDTDIGDYRCGYGLDASNITLQLGGAGQTLSVATLPDYTLAHGLSITAIEKGLTDNASVAVSLIDWSLPTATPLLLMTGICAEVKYGSAGTLELSLNTPMSQDRTLCGDVLSQMCRADFGDPACGIDITSMVDGPRVAAAIDQQNVLLSPDEHSPDGYYNNGTVYFTTGPNKGSGYEILTISEPDENGRSTLTTKVPIAFDPLPGDFVALYPGCDKVITSGCTYWNNTANFQGEPFTADQSDILPPSAGS